MTASAGRRRSVLEAFPVRDAAPTPPVFERAVVEFRRLKAKDDYVAFPYSQLVWLNYYPSYGIIAHMSSHTVHVIGVRLEKIYQGLRDQTLRQVQMQDENAVERDQPVVTNIFIIPKSASDPGFARLEIKDLEVKDA